MNTFLQSVLRLIQMWDFYFKCDGTLSFHKTLVHLYLHLLVKQFIECSTSNIYYICFYYIKFRF